MSRIKLRTFIALTITALSLLAATAFAQQNTREIFERARMLDESNQNLSEAIKLYGQVVSQSNEQRALAARAQYRIGMLYERLGRKAEAQRAFQAVVKQYGDQPEASRARAKLPASAVRNEKKSVSAGNAGMINVQKWTGSKVDLGGDVSPDGRYLSFVDWDTGDLALHDFTTGADRRLTNKGTWAQSMENAEESTISHDGTQIAYTWWSGKNGPEIRLLKVEGLATSKPKILFDNPNTRWISIYDWSPDGKWLAVGLTRESPRIQQLGVVNTTDGSFRILKSVSGSATKMFFSPDGASIAYDLRAGNTSEQRDVFVMSVDGSQDTAVVVNPASDVVVGWSPDGRSLLFASDRTGSMAIWALPFQNGKPQGTPVFLKDLGSSAVSILGLTQSGSLLYGLTLGGNHIDVASVDFETGKVLAPPRQIEIAERYLLEDQHADWSRDGKHIAYISGTRNRALVIRSVEGGQVRVVPLTSNVVRPRWSPDGSILVQGPDSRRRQGIYRVDLQSGDLSPVVISNPDTFSIQFSVSPDGKLLFYRRGRRESPRNAIIERNLASGNERELVRADNDLFGLSLSPDGRQITFIERDEHASNKDARDTLYIMPVDGGPRRELFRAARLWNIVEWTPDGRHIVFSSQQEKPKYWIIPSSGGTPVRLELEGISPFYSLRIHPDGRRIAFNSGSRKNEVWALENFLSKPKAKEQSRSTIDKRR